MNAGAVTVPGTVWHQRWAEAIRLFLRSGVDIARTTVGAVVDLVLLPFDLFIRSLRLNVYGASLYGPRVESELWKVGVIMTAQYALDCVAWWGFFHPAFPDSPWTARTLTLVVATMILVYDRSVVVQDQKRSSKAFFWGRVALAVFFSMLTAQGMALAVFSRDIDSRIRREQDAATTQIRSRAMTQEVRQLERAGDTSLAATNETLRVRRADLDHQREMMRAARVAEHNRLAAIEEGLSHDTTTAATEHGHYGNGPVSGRLEVRTSVAHQNLVTFDADAEARRVTFENNAAAELQRLEATRDGQLGANADSIRTKRAEIEHMSGFELADRYGGHMPRVDGPLERQRVLDQLEDEDPMVRYSVMAYHMLMVVLGLLVIGAKKGLSLETQNHFSFERQVRAQQEHAAALARAMGVDHAAKFGRSEEIQALIDSLRAAQNACAEEIEKFRENLREFAKPKGLPKLAPTFQAMREHMFRAATKHREAIGKVQAARAKLGDTGVAVEEWPTHLNGGEDPTVLGYDLTDLTAKQLADKYGWVDPSDEIEEMLKAVGRIPEERRILRREFNLAEEHLEKLVGEKHPHAHILARMARYSRANLVPALDRIFLVERVASFAGELPGWPEHAPDPRLGLERLCQPTREDLIALGWRDPEVIEIEDDMEEAPEPLAGAAPVVPLPI